MCTAVGRTTGVLPVRWSCVGTTTTRGHRTRGASASTDPVGTGAASVTTAITRTDCRSSPIITITTITGPITVAKPASRRAAAHRRVGRPSRRTSADLRTPAVPSATSRRSSMARDAHEPPRVRAPTAAAPRAAPVDRSAPRVIRHAPRRRGHPRAPMVLHAQIRSPQQRHRARFRCARRRVMAPRPMDAWQPLRRRVRPPRRTAS